MTRDEGLQPPDAQHFTVATPTPDKTVLAFAGALRHQEGVPEQLLNILPVSAPETTVVTAESNSESRQRSPILQHITTTLHTTSEFVETMDESPESVEQLNFLLSSLYFAGQSWLMSTKVNLPPSGQVPKIEPVQSDVARVTTTQPPAPTDISPEEGEGSKRTYTFDEFHREVIPHFSRATARKRFNEAYTTLGYSQPGTGNRIEMTAEEFEELKGRVDTTRRTGGRRAKQVVDEPNEPLGDGDPDGDDPDPDPDSADRVNANKKEIKAATQMVVTIHSTLDELTPVLQGIPEGMRFVIPSAANRIMSDLALDGSNSKIEIEELHQLGIAYGHTAINYVSLLPRDLASIIVYRKAQLNGETRSEEIARTIANADSYLTAEELGLLNSTRLGNPLEDVEQPDSLVIQFLKEKLGTDSIFHVMEFCNFLAQEARYKTMEWIEGNENGEELSTNFTDLLDSYIVRFQEELGRNPNISAHTHDAVNQRTEQEQDSYQTACNTIKERTLVVAAQFSSEFLTIYKSTQKAIQESRELRARFPLAANLFESHPLIGRLRSLAKRIKLVSDNPELENIRLAANLLISMNEDLYRLLVTGLEKTETDTARILKDANSIARINQTLDLYRQLQESTPKAAA
ncbi:hypothetical protein HY468_03390 [Candidatus Roizmanbacteria bacterium]|nr:hypothetical protein [Candidatus Roizmanbacteria bacterium]